MIPGVPDFGIGPAPVPGVPHSLAPGLLRVTAPNPGLMTGPGTNTYVVGETELAVIDPGPDDEGHRAALLAAVPPGAAIKWVLVTHTHVDHAPGAAPLAEATGAEVVGFGPAEKFAPDLRVGGGWTLTLPGITLEAIHTPGHSSDHLCWLWRESRTLLTGDHVMHGSTVVIRPPDGDLATYLDSLAKVRDLDPGVETLAPGHGRLMDHVGEVVEALIAHRRGRHERIAEALRAAGEGTVDDLLPAAYSDVTEQQLPVARFSLWAHLRYLAGQGRAEAVGVAAPDEDTVETRWRWVA